MAIVACLVATGAQASPRWQLGPRLQIGQQGESLPLKDGRLLTCFGDARGDRCELVDPLSGSHATVPIQHRAGMFAGALALDDGQVLLPAENALIEPQTGAKRRLPPPGRDLRVLSSIALSEGRAAFWRESSQGCWRSLLLFLGAEQGYREIEAAPAGTCVEGVFDLQDGRALIARSTPSRSRAGESDLDFALLNLRDWTWQLGPRMPLGWPKSAFRDGSGIVILLYPRYEDRGEALFLDRDGKKQRRLVFAQRDLDLRAQRLGNEYVFFDRNGALLWNPARASLTPLLWPIPPLVDPHFVERNGTLLAIDYRGKRALILERNPPPRQTPCDDIFMYAETVIAYRDPSIGLSHLRLLMRSTEGKACRAYIEREKRFPDVLQAPLDALLQRTAGAASVEEELAARLLCALLPGWGAPLFTRISESGHLSEQSAASCQDASEQLPVVTAADTPRGASAELARRGLQRDANGVSVRRWVASLLDSRDDIARAAGPLLRAAGQQGASGFVLLHAQLCTTPPPDSELLQACQTEDPKRKPDPKRRAKRARILVNLGVATGVLGGLTGLAYAGRNSDAGRALAIGCGAVGGGALGLGLTLATAKGGDMRGMSALLLAVPLTLGGAVAGGLIAAKTSEEPGAPRFATAAVPLSGLWLTGVGFAIEAW